MKDADPQPEKKYFARTALCFSLVLNLLSCTNQHSDHKKDVQKPKSSDNIVSRESTTADPGKKKQDLMCPDNAEMVFYNKNSKSATRSGNDGMLYLYSNGLVHVKILFEKCQPRYRQIESTSSCAASHAKFAGGKLITFDSTDRNCNKLIEYVDGTFFSENKELPGYLLEYVPKDRISVMPMDR